MIKVGIKDPTSKYHYIGVTVSTYEFWVGTNFLSTEGLPSTDVCILLSRGLSYMISSQKHLEVDSTRIIMALSICTNFPSKLLHAVVRTGLQMVVGLVRRWLYQDLKTSNADSG